MEASLYPAREIKKAPTNLVENGQYNLGCFNTPVQNANLLDIPSAFNLPLPRLLKSIQLREWQAFQIKDGDHFVMMAIYNAKKISLVQFIVYNLKTKDKVKYEKKCLSWNLEVPDTLYNSTASYRSDNFTIVVEHDLTTHKLEIDVNIVGFEDLPTVKAHFKGVHDVSKYTPMVVCNPFSSDRVMYSHKCLMPGEGTLKIGDRETVVFAPATTQVIIDDHKGYYPYITTYDWVTGLGMDKNNQVIGFNLTNNQVILQDVYNENCLWMEGKLFPLPPIKIDRPEGYTGVWHITDAHDMVNLHFTPVTHTTVRLNFLIMCSEYEGPYGVYTGYLRKAETGEKVEIDNMFGMGEDFYLRA